MAGGCQRYDNGHVLRSLRKYGLRFLLTSIGGLPAGIAVVLD
jgi:hypothetical protein